MSLSYCTLVSGSSGNAAYIENGRDALLLDAGVTGAALFRLLDRQSLDPGKIRAVLVTHEHTDHSRGAGIVARKLGVPLHATPGTWQAIAAAAGPLKPGQLRLHAPGQGFAVGSLHLETFALHHDAREPCGYVVGCRGTRVAFVTDTGRVDPGLCDRIRGCQGLVIEANHDPGMLDSGPYPAFLKKRIRSSHGHLSNQDCAQVLKALAGDGLQHITLAHLSRENNLPQLALETVRGFLQQTAGLQVTVAPRFSPHPLIRL